jgi:hypothetical protein
MQRTRLSEQLLQSSLLQRLVRADRDAIAPATNLVHGKPMTGSRLAHLNLKLVPGAIASAQPLFFSAENAKSGGFLGRFGRHLIRVPNAGRTRKADRARPEAPRRVQPITFAFCSPPEAVPAVFAATDRQSVSSGP